MRNSRGFTLIELVIVVVVIGIVSSVAAPNIARLFTTAQLRQEAQMLALTLKNLQGHAALQRAPYSLTFNFENQSYHSSRGESKYNDFALTLEDLTGTGENILGEAYSDRTKETFTEHEIFYEDEYAAVTNLRSRIPMRETSRTLPESVKLECLIDSFDEEHSEDPYTITFDAKGNVEPCTVILCAANNPKTRYIVDLTFTGQATFYREDLDEDF